MHTKSGLWSRVAVLFVFLIASIAVAPAVADAVPPGKSIIYLITRDTGAFSSVLVSVNGKIVGTAMPASHLVITANSGATEIGSAGSGRGTISLTTVSGGYFYVSHSIGMSGVPEFRVLSEAEGQAALARTRKLAEIGSVPVLSPDSAPRSIASGGAESGYGRHSDDVSPENDRGKQAVAIILKGGAYKISQELQTTDGSPTIVEGKSTSVGGIEVEWRHPKGFAVGGEIFYFRNAWADNIGYAGNVSTVAYGVNGKYYLGIANIVYPYVGIGVGYAISAFSGSDGVSTWDSVSTGISYQGLIGVEFRFKYVGINLQYKQLTADVKTTLADGTTETNKMGGSGQLLGLAIHIPLR